MGEYRLELKIGEKSYDITPPFTNGELHLIKKVAGVRAGEFEEALESGDNDMLVALACVAARRNGTARPTLEELWEMEAGSIELVEHEPPAEGDPTPAGDAGATGNQETTPQDSGSPSTATSSTSPPETSAT
jgi:hypothetical protein